MRHDYQGYIPRNIASYGFILNNSGEMVSKGSYSDFINELLRYAPGDLAKIIIDLEKREEKTPSLEDVASQLSFSSLQFNLNDNNGRMHYDGEPVDFSVEDPIYLDYRQKHSSFREIISDELLRGILQAVNSFSLRLSLKPNGSLDKPKGSLDIVIATHDHKLPEHWDLSFRRDTLNVLKAYSYWTLCA